MHYLANLFVILGFFWSSIFGLANHQESPVPTRTGTSNTIELPATQTSIPSLIILNDSFAKDKAHVYTMSEEPGGKVGDILENADPATFTGVGEYGGKDAHHVWWNISNGYIDGYILVPDADPATFAVFGQYAKDATHVFDLAFNRPTPIPGADSATFESINSTYYKDVNHVYLDYAFPGCKDGAGTPVFFVIQGADPRTFVPLTPPYSKDAKHVFYGSEIISGADPATFSVISYDYFDPQNDPSDLYGHELSRDAHTLYLRGQTVSNFNPQGALTATSSYFWSGASVAYLTEGDGCAYGIGSVESIPGADAASFVPLTAGYAKDAAHVYYNGTPIPGADPATFEF